MKTKLTTRRPSTGTFLGTLALVVALSGAAAAAIPDAGGVITTCFSKATGTWRPIDSGQQCKKDEQQLSLYTKGGADAAFLARTAKAADSDLLDGIDSSQFLTAGSAVDADTLDSLDSTDFLRSSATAGGVLTGPFGNLGFSAGAKAPDADKLGGSTLTQVRSGIDADKLDGLNSSDFLRSDAAAGGDLAGNFPNPTIGAGRVASSNIADGAITTAKLSSSATAPDSDKLGGAIAALYLKKSFNGTIAVDLPEVQAGSCGSSRERAFGGAVQSSDLGVVSPVMIGAGLIISATPGPGDITFTGCNLTPSSIDPPSTPFRVITFG